MKNWKLPKWMEPYRQHFVNTGGNSIEDLMNRNTSPLVNLPLSTLEACAKSQVLFLDQLRNNGLLKTSTVVPK